VTGDLPHVQQRGSLEPHTERCRNKDLEGQDFGQKA
jgi:hypothetical protein